MAAHMRGTLGRENQIKRPLKLQVHIVEDHNDVLPHVYRAIGSRQIPFSDICLLHFDSHPDMLIPGQFNADNVFDKETLYQELSIENWIIPATYAGHFNRVVWIKPEWAVQIEDKVTDFIVGKNKQSGKIRLTSKENYFVSELLYSHEEELENCKQLMLQVATLSRETDTKDLKAKIVENLQVEIYERDVVEQDDPQMSKIQQIENSSEYCDDESDDTHGRQQRFISEVIHTKRSCEKNSKCSENSGELTKKRCKLVCDEKDGRDNFVTVARPYILDIDLDFFSTANPFKEMYSEDQYRLLRKLYFCKLPKDADDKVLNDFIKKRTVQLAELKEIFLNMKKGGTLSDSSSERNTLIDELVSDLRRTRKEEDIDYEWLHEAGCTCDDSELPHHISTEDEIKQFMQKVKDLLQNLPRPALVTIARSSDDDYCPKWQVDDIQEGVMRILREVYLDIDVHPHYQHDD